MGAYGSYVVETFVTLVAVCGLAFVVLYGAKRMGLGRASGPIALVGQLPLDARRAIYLVRVGKQVLVVGAAEGGFTKLGETSVDDLGPLDEPSAAPLSFAAVLAKARGATKAADAATSAAPPMRAEAASQNDDGAS